MAALPVDNADTFQRWLLEEFNDNARPSCSPRARRCTRDSRRGLNEVRMAYVLEAEKIARHGYPQEGHQGANAKMIRHIVMWKFREGTGGAGAVPHRTACGLFGSFPAQALR